MADRDDLLAQYYGPAVTTADVIGAMPYRGDPMDLKAQMRDRAMRGQVMSPEMTARIAPDPPREANIPWLRRALNAAMEFSPEAMFAANFLAPSVRLPFHPKTTVPAYHGTTRWEGDTIRTPMWMAENPMYAETFAGRRGSILPLEVDTSNYLHVRDGSWLQKLDDRIGHGRQMERDGRNWLADIAKGLGKSGIRWDYNWYDQGPVMLALNPNSVRGKFGAFPGVLPSSPMLTGAYLGSVSPSLQALTTADILRSYYDDDQQ